MNKLTRRNFLKRVGGLLAAAPFLSGFTGIPAGKPGHPGQPEPIVPPAPVRGHMHCMVYPTVPTMIWRSGCQPEPYRIPVAPLGPELPVSRRLSSWSDDVTLNLDEYSWVCQDCDHINKWLASLCEQCGRLRDA